MTLVEQYALLPDEIDQESLKMVQASLPRDLALTPNEHYVLCPDTSQHIEQVGKVSEQRTLNPLAAAKPGVFC